ncbi:MAG: hypothetical protein MHPSP_004001, partial [Paramarteilia canceri]
IIYRLDSEEKSPGEHQKTKQAGSKSKKQAESPANFSPNQAEEPNTMINSIVSNVKPKIESVIGKLAQYLD